jgi:hypothetical protein
VAGRNLPPPQSPFTNEDRTLSNDGYQFLLGLLNATANDVPTASVDSGIAAAGVNQATATALTSQWNEVATSPVGGGVLLSSYEAGQQQVVFNESVNGINVYPPPGAQINALGVNIAFALGSGARQTFDFVSSTQIRT